MLRGTGVRGYGKPHPAARDHQAGAPETAAGRGVSRTTGTQKAGWLRMRGREDTGGGS